MNEDTFEIIELDDKEYAIVKKIKINEKNYFLLNEIKEEKLEENTIVLEEKEGYLYSIEDEQEKFSIMKYILNEIKSVEE